MPSTRHPRLLILAALALLQSLLLLRSAAALPIEGAISIAPGLEPPSTKVRRTYAGGAHWACVDVDVCWDRTQSTDLTMTHLSAHTPLHTQVILNGGAHVAFTAADGSFQFPDVPAGAFWGLVDGLID